MLSSLYRLYLYVVFTLMTLFVVLSLNSMVSQLLAFTPLNQNSANYLPDRASLTQSFVFAVTALIVAGALGGLHYWLIRREQREDAAPGASVIRAIFLNGAEGLYVLALTIPLGLSIFSFTPTTGYDISGPVAFAICAALAVALLEFERRRIPATPGAAGAFQRIHFYGVQMVVLLSLTFFLPTVLATTERLVLRNTGVNLCAPSPDGVLPSSCYQLLAGSEWLGALFVVGVWAIYGFLSRTDQRSIMRQVFHVVGYSFGVMVSLWGIERALEYALRLPFNQPLNMDTYANAFDSPPILLFGALIVAAYYALLRTAAAHTPTGSKLLSLIMQALVAIFLAAPFWYALAMALYHLMRGVAQNTLTTDLRDWPQIISLLIIGAVSIPFAFSLSVRSERAGIRNPQRGFELAMLGLGCMTVAVSAVVLLYTLMTTALNVPLQNWEDTARLAGSGLSVGLALAGLYLWNALREGMFVRRPAPIQPAPAPLTTTASVAHNGAAHPEITETVEEILDELVSRQLTREQAAERIHELVH